MAQRFEESVLEVLGELGTGALSNPRTFAGLVADVYGPDEPESIVLAYHCDGQFMSFFAEAVSSPTPESLSLAASRAEMLLVDERFVAPQHTSSVACGISRALATHLGVAVPGPGGARPADEAWRREGEDRATAEAEAARRRAEAEAARRAETARRAAEEEQRRLDEAAKAEAARKAAASTWPDMAPNKRKLNAVCAVLLALACAAGAGFLGAISTAFAQFATLLAVLWTLGAVGLWNKKPAVEQVLAALACVGCAVHFRSTLAFSFVLFVAAYGYGVSAVSIWQKSRQAFGTDQAGATW